MRRFVRTVPLPLMAALLLAGSGWRVAEAGTNDSFAASLATAAFILLGAWIREFSLSGVDIQLEQSNDDIRER